MRIPATTDLGEITRAAENLIQINNSETSKTAGTIVELYEIDSSTTLDNGTYPVIGTSTGPLVWTVYSPGAFEKLSPERREFAALIQGHHPAKSFADYYDIDQAGARMLQEARDTIVSIWENKNFICVLVPETGVAGDQIVVVRGDEDCGLRIEVFDVDETKFNEAAR